jgi:hypothetical protein
VLALIINTVAPAIMFVYDQWKMWRHETASRRTAERRGDSAN